ncbi:MAG: type II toxin-antitoxin system Phd/YefM family antitoxin [Actinomycetes bacterium]
MREITATEAARGFSALLDAVERDGETFVVTRGGRPVARIEAAGGTTGKAVKALLDHYGADADWADELAALRDPLTDQERSWRG